jgi:hypothetical protein
MDFPLNNKRQVAEREEFLKKKCQNCPMPKRRKFDGLNYCNLHHIEMDPEGPRKLNCIFATTSLGRDELKNCPKTNCPLYHRIKQKEERAKKSKASTAD